MVLWLAKDVVPNVNCSPRGPAIWVSQVASREYCDSVLRGENALDATYHGFFGQNSSADVSRDEGAADTLAGTKSLG